MATTTFARGLVLQSEPGEFRPSVRTTAYDTQTDLEIRFAKAQLNLSPSRRRLLRNILENPEDAYYLSSRELARRYQVDAATIVRTIQVLGYQKFAEFLADLRSHFVRRITPYTVLKAAS